MRTFMALFLIQVYNITTDGLAQYLTHVDNGVTASVTDFSQGSIVPAVITVSIIICFIQDIVSIVKGLN